MRIQNLSPNTNYCISAKPLATEKEIIDVGFSNELCALTGRRHIMFSSFGHKVRLQ